MITTTPARAAQHDGTGGTWAGPQAAVAPRQDLRDFHLAGWLVQPTLDCATCDDVVIRIRPQLMDMLVCLAARAGKTVSREDLLATVWSGRFVVESCVSRCVAELRQALGDSARQPRIIETIPKRGYRLIAPVLRAPAPVLAVGRDTGAGSGSSPGQDAGSVAARGVTAVRGVPPTSPLDRAIACLRNVAMTFGAHLWKRV
jgi:DNA-binding winged helix-turn-helix (wHTH) protein